MRKPAHCLVCIKNPVIEQILKLTIKRAIKISVLSSLSVLLVRGVWYFNYHASINWVDLFSPQTVIIAVLAIMLPVIYIQVSTYLKNRLAVL